MSTLTGSCEEAAAWRRVRGFVWMATLAAGILVASTPFALRWSVPCEGPPSTDELEGAASVLIEPFGSEWSVTIAFTTPVVGHRTLKANSCEEGSRAAKLLLRLGAAGGLTGYPPVDVPQPRASTLPVRVVPSLGTSVELVVGAELGGLPAVTPRVGLGGWLYWRVLAFGVRVKAGVPARYEGGPVNAGFIAHPALGGELMGCGFFLRSGRLGVGPCVEFSFEWWRLTGDGVEVPRTGHGVFMTVGPALRATIELARGFQLTGSLGGGVAVVRPSLELTGYGVVFVAPPFRGAATLGLAWRFGEGG